MNTIYITKDDRQKLINLIYAKISHNQDDKDLLAELEGATIVESTDIPEDVITMNSLVIFQDVEAGTDLKCWLVFPKDADLKQGKISVLSPIGCALLGYRVGDIIGVQTPSGEKKLKVEKILFQPEARGNYE